MKHSRILLFYLLATATVLYARFAQIAYLTEEGNGFFAASGMPIAIALCIFIILAVIVAAVLSFFSRRTPKAAPEWNVPLCVCSAVLAAVLIYETVFVEYLTNALLFTILARIFAALSAISLVLYAIKGFKMPKLLWLCPVFFFLFKLVSVFTVYATVSVIADNVFYLCFLCSALVFYLNLAKLENSVSPRNSSYLLFPAAVVSSISALCCFVPQLFIMILGKRELLHSEPQSYPLCFAFAAFSICYTLSLYSKKNLVNRHRQTHRLKSGQTYTELGNQFIIGEKENDE